MNDLIVIEDDAEPALPVMVGAQEIAACNAQAAYVEALAGRTVTQSYILGAMLHSVKSKCKHGEWGKLFGEGNATRVSHFNFTKRQAERYMQLFHACGEHAERQGLGEHLRELLSYTTGPMDGAIDVEAKVEELGSMLHSLTGGATSMRQALFAFMDEDASNSEPESAQEFFRGGRNKKGRVRPKKDEGKSEAELLEERRWAISKQLEGLACGIDDLGSEIALAFPEARDHAIATMERSLKILQKLK